MVQKLTESKIAECQAKFNLSYHVPFARICQDLVGFEGKDVLEVGGSLPPEFVFDYLHVKSWSAIETPDYEESLKKAGGLSHKGTIIPNVKDTSNLGFANRKLEKYNFFLENIENLPQEHYKKYNLIFSIATFEHIQKLPTALDKMFLALKLGGKLFSMFSPIWSAHDGHHLPKITDQTGKVFNFGNSPIPPWGHLLMKPNELCHYLYQYTDKETAELMVDYVYNSLHINRCFTEDYLEIIQQSRFQSQQIKLIFENSIDENIQETLEKLYPGRKEFSNNGILVVLEKKDSEEKILSNREIKQTNRKFPEDLLYQQQEISSQYPSLNVLIFFLGRKELYRPVIFSKKEIFCSPHCQTEIKDGEYYSIKTPSGVYDITNILDRLPPSQKPDLIIVKADSTGANFPINLQSISCPKILICGNTQHLSKPIQTLVKYALEEEFDFIMSDHKRHHLHYFKEAGFEKVFWVPGFNINPYPQERNLTSKYPLIFVGQVGQFHPYRKSILAALKQLNFPIHQLQASQQKAAEIYAESLINLNVSMNGDLNLRVFEVLSSGGFLLTDKLSPQSGLELLFEDNKHLALFSSESELRQKINFFLENPQIARKIAFNGCEKFWQNHSPELNIQRVIDYIDGKDIDPIYNIEAERRSIYIHSNDLEALDRRISIYEFIQELHLNLKKSSIKVLFWPQIDQKIICDVIDLPRLEVNIICDDYKEGDSDISINLFYQCQVEKQITFIDSLQLQSQAQSWDLIILTRQELEKIGINQLLTLINFKNLMVVEDTINANGNLGSQFDSFFERFGLVKQSNNPLAYSWNNKSDWGTFLLAQKKNVVGIRAFEQALQDNPCDIKALVELGLLYAKLDDLTEAEKLLYKAVSLERRNLIAMKNLAKVLMGLSKYDVAANILEYLIEINLEEIELWSWLEKCYLQQGLEQKALNIYRRCNYLMPGKSVDKDRENLTESNPKITPQKILVINNLYPPQELGGYGRSISDFANVLQQRGHTIKVLTSDAPYLTKITTAEPNINRNLQLFGTFEGGAKAIENPQEIQRIIVHNNQIIREVIDEFSPDVCLVGNINFLGPEIFRPLLENYIPVINHLGLPSLLCSADQMPQNNYFILATASEYVRQKVLTQGYTSEKTIIVYPGAKVKKFQMCMLPNMDKLRIVYAGLIIDSKGTHTLIEALKIIDDENVDFECSIAGDNNIDRDYFTRLKQFIVRNSMEEKVKFLGYLQLEELIHLYSSKNVIVFPSIGPEAFGISPVEGMAAGLTAISTGVGGGSETIEHNVSGLIFPAGDSFALAQTLIGLAKDVEKWQRIAATGKQKALNIFDIENSVDTLADKFEELLEQRSSDPKYLQNIILPELKTRLKLRNINLIMFPNWSQSEEILIPELEMAIATFFTHPRNSQMTLLIDTTNISEEEANLALSGIVMNLMMQENLEVSEESEISLLGQINEMEWTALLPYLHGRIILANENSQAVTIAKADTVSRYSIESLKHL